MPLPQLPIENATEGTGFSLADFLLTCRATGEKISIESLNDLLTHAALAGIQGGSTGQLYHLTATELDDLQRSSRFSKIIASGNL